MKKMMIIAILLTYSHIINCGDLLSQAIEFGWQLKSAKDAFAENTILELSLTKNDISEEHMRSFVDKAPKDIGGNLILIYGLVNHNLILLCKKFYVDKSLFLNPETLRVDLITEYIKRVNVIFGSLRTLGL
jgi:hypothetical protein